MVVFDVLLQEHGMKDLDSPNTPPTPPAAAADITSAAAAAPAGEGPAPRQLLFSLPSPAEAADAMADDFAFAFTQRSAVPESTQPHRAAPAAAGNTPELQKLLPPPAAAAAAAAGGQGRSVAGSSQGAASRKAASSPDAKNIAAPAATAAVGGISAGVGFTMGQFPSRKAVSSCKGANGSGRGSGSNAVKKLSPAAASLARFRAQPLPDGSGSNGSSGVQPPVSAAAMAAAAAGVCGDECCGEAELQQYLEGQQQLRLQHGVKCPCVLVRGGGWTCVTAHA